MIKLKGDGESMAQRVMNKALGGKTPSNAIVDNRGGHGDLNEPTQMARNLGMPSAMKQQQRAGQGKDWSNQSNRINMGGTVYMKSKTNVDADYEDRGYKAESKEDGLVDLGGSSASAASKKEGGNSDDEFEDEFGDGADEGGAVAQWRQARMAELQKNNSKNKSIFRNGSWSLYRNSSR